MFFQDEDQKDEVETGAAGETDEVKPEGEEAEGTEGM